ncbi:phosphoribosyl-AMP cyclohydrolase [Accumulibacter sp.]|uniref:phosphoribosyl-AMP cyclohydrolase n=1 Tax=Accumulibacter sp. TaxID=2053492 RepID=UPI0025EAFD08|nr:phosphoribosyl-AMP cyclohydrolase [Accumulibacter sp.]MCM8596276.1 phosphoribosyl-AMP cyclohydrolase [Accumulibacter sp.]MCM8627207.1 phosphoribosyl-AMP cyclohydrolase [Accumulibacter sp.]MDS4050425.1 phosphoribosyl-AMP cyclohydrolase [Accumulibacter sp.]
MSDLEATRNWLDALKWADHGQIPAIAQDAASGHVPMFADMNRESLDETVDSGRAVYWSRSRQRPWRKGEESGDEQRVHSLRTDCDGDVLLLAIDQRGGSACHTGRESCFFHQLQGESWVLLDPVLRDPKDIYGK